MVALYNLEHLDKAEFRRKKLAAQRRAHIAALEAAGLK